MLNRESPTLFRLPETKFVSDRANAIFANHLRRRGGELHFIAEIETPLACGKSKRKPSSGGSVVASQGASTGSLKTTRIVTPPRYRPENVLKREMYRFACGVFDGGYQDQLKRLAIAKARSLEINLRERRWTVVDWAIRYVRVAGCVRHSAISSAASSPLFSDTMLGRFCTELNFAFAHNIEPDLCTTFIDECGGHEIIGVMLSTGSYRDYDAPWVRRMMGEPRVRVLNKVGVFGRRTLPVEPVTGSDMVEEQRSKPDAKPKRFKMKVKNAAGEVRIVHTGKKREKGR